MYVAFPAIISMKIHSMELRVITKITLQLFVKNSNKNNLKKLVNGDRFVQNKKLFECAIFKQYLRPDNFHF